MLMLDCRGYVQELGSAIEQQLETITAAEESETEDDAYLQQLDFLRRHPLNLNTADASDLAGLLVVSEAQVASFLAYRKLLGNLVDIYELQAVPFWDLETIRKIRPLVFAGPANSIKETVAKRLKGGEQSLLFRVSYVMEKARGFKEIEGNARYLGSRPRLYVRYRYTYKNLLQYGILGDKDAGESFFGGKQKAGFDFYSAHLFIRKLGKIEAIALGDFTVNMGQGLVQWQSMAFKKSAELVSVKRQSPVLRPYNSAGEFNFHRGVGVVLRMRKIEASFFASMKRINANRGVDSLGKAIISSFLASGNNRSINEIADRHSVKQTAFGSSLQWTRGGGKVGLNAVYYLFSLPVQKRKLPYNLYAWGGGAWYNLSADYSYTYRNFHFFGETALDKRGSPAFIHGLLVSVDGKVDFSLLHRQIAPAYQAVVANAFTENSLVSNERGIFMGVSVRPFKGWRFDFYKDLYGFAWLKYQVDAPSRGNDFMVQVLHTPSRQVEISSRFRWEEGMRNRSATAEEIDAMNYPVIQSRANWRLQVNVTVSPSVTLRQRVELSGSRVDEDSSYSGFLTFCDIVYKPMMKPLSVVVRWQFFETDGYGARVYAFENDVLYSSSIPAMFGKGMRYYATVGYDVKRDVSVWVRWAQTVYRGQEVIGTGMDEIAGNKKSEVKFQVRWLF